MLNQYQNKNYKSTHMGMGEILAPLIDKLEKDREKYMQIIETKMEDARDTFEPFQIGEIVLKKEELFENRYWIYNHRDQKFYLYENGFWQRKTSMDLTKSIRSILRKIKKSWSRTSNAKEVIEALKLILSDERYPDLFDPGKSPDFKHINVKNGMLDWKSGGLKQHHKDYFSIFQLNIEYEPEASYDKWEEALKSWLSDEETILFLQEYIGYMLIPDTSFHKSVILYGEGSNGKSTFLKVIQKLFGDLNLANVSLNEFSDPNSARWASFRLVDKLVNICSDVDPQCISKTGPLKTLIAGETSKAEEKYHTPFDFIPVCRFLFSSNELPRSKDKSDGWYRRLEFVEFPNSFSAEDENFDRFLDKKLQYELSGIFNWALKGLRRLYENNSFTISSSMKRLKSQYLLVNDPIREFAKDNLLITQNHTDDFVKTEKVYKKYNKWAKKNGFKKPMHKSAFSERSKKLGIEVEPKRFKGKTVRFYTGVKLKE
ncbi:MAG: DNA primase family protein [Candidatus Woesearchaeota archaeon]